MAYDYQTYTNPGNLSEVAQASNTDLDILMKQNNITDANKLQAGTTIDAPYNAPDIPTGMTESTQGTELQGQRYGDLPEHIFRAELQGNEAKLTQWHGKNSNTIGAGLDLDTNASSVQNAIRRVAKDEQDYQDIISKKKSMTKRQAMEASNLVYKTKMAEIDTVFTNAGVDLDSLPEYTRDIVENIAYYGGLSTSDKAFSYLKDGKYGLFKKEVMKDEVVKTRLKNGGLLNQEEHLKGKSAFAERMRIAEDYQSKMQDVINDSKLSEDAKWRILNSLYLEATQKAQPTTKGSIKELMGTKE